ncbi:hypothetical protein ACM66B_003199 [Microbotryomycetes sp. NB124-2]
MTDSMTDIDTLTASPFTLLLKPTFPSINQHAFTALTRLLDSLVTSRATQHLNDEIKSLEASLRDEYEPRSAALKADYFARVVHGAEQDRPDEERMIPTIVSDVDDVEQMSKNVDERVVKDLQVRQEQARGALEQSARRQAQLEVEMLVMTPLLHWQSDGIEDEQELYDLLVEFLQSN